MPVPFLQPVGKVSRTIRRARTTQEARRILESWGIESTLPSLQGSVAYNSGGLTNRSGRSCPDKFRENFVIPPVQMVAPAEWLLPLTRPEFTRARGFCVLDVPAFGPAFGV